MVISTYVRDQVDQLSRVFCVVLCRLVCFVWNILLCKAWLWGPAQEDAFKKVKTELFYPTVLALYDPCAEIEVSADASQGSQDQDLPSYSVGSYSMILV